MRPYFPFNKRPMNEKHMSNYFEGDVLETAKKAIKEIRRKAREDLKVAP